MTVSKARDKFQHTETVVKVVTVIKPVNVILPQYITSEKTDLQVVYKKLA
jgi:hypothetical protein